MFLVGEITKKLSEKADISILKEKELRLSESIKKDFGRLSSETSLLRWVIYLLVIGLTASGGLFVMIQRRRQ